MPTSGNSIRSKWRLHENGAEGVAGVWENSGVTDPIEPKQVQSSEQQQVQVRRAPRYGVFMGLGAVIGAVGCGLVSFLVEPGTQADGTRVDTTPVIGLMVVVGFVLGAALGALVAVVLERTVGRRSRAAEVELTSVVLDESARDAAAGDRAGPAATGSGREAAPASADSTATVDDTEMKP